MKLPNGEQAIIDERKVREYLLSPSHPVGRFKLKFFAGIGFGPESWRPFIAALAELAEKGEARIAEEGEFGQEYSASGLLTGPRGRAVSVVSVWIFELGSDKPRLVTVYPKEP